jgi:hypothetical protein
MPFGLGFFATAGAGAAGSFDLLETQTLSSSQASVTFSSLSTYASTYQHLQIRVVTAPTANGATLWGQFNADTTSNYNYHYLYGNGSAVSSSGAATSNGVLLGGVAGFENTYFMGAVMDILDPFETTKNKVTRTLSGGAAKEIDLCSGLWRSTNAISEIKLYFTGTNLAQYSRFSLYGWKAA